MSDFLPELKRHSASQLTSFLEYRTDWFMERIAGIKKFEENINTARGKAIESAINFFLYGFQDIRDDKGEPLGSRDMTECIRHAISEWDRYTENIQDDKKLEYKQSIGPAVDAAIGSFRDKYDIRKLVMQHNINITLDGCSKPLTGFLDYVQFDPRHGLVIDNKVSGRTPSQLSQAYQIQGSIYRKATGLPVEFHFVIPLKKGPEIKVIRLSDAEYEYGLNLATKAALAIEQIFSDIQNIEYNTLRALFFPNPDAYYDQNKAREVRKYFGIDSTN